MGRWGAELSWVSAGCALLLGCGGAPARDPGFDPDDPLAVAREYVEMNLTCRNPGYAFVYDPTFTGPFTTARSRIRGCDPRPVPRIEARQVRRAGDRVLVATTLDGAPGGSLWLVHADGGYLVAAGPPPRR
jgi:hypothetical protein